MGDYVKIGSQITVGGAVTEEELRKLAKKGVKAVVNLRQEGEDERQIPTAKEEQIARSAGMDYVHLPVTMRNLDFSVVEQFSQAIERLPKPVHVHCKAGTRAGAFAVMHMATHQAMSGEEALARADIIGLNLSSPDLRQFIKAYIDQHIKVRA